MKVGLEKESLIFDENFKPREFKKEELNKNIYLDFANHQLELISSVHNTTFDLVKQMYELSNEERIINYNMWPLSQPGILNTNIKHDVLGGEAHEYRERLAKKYDGDFMTLSGIHYNFDLNIEVDNQSEYYFNLMKKIYEFSPLILQFVAYTPFYQKDIFNFKLDNIGKNVGLKNSLSLRSSIKYGYMNHDKVVLDYSTLQTFNESKRKLIENKVILSEAEIYTPIRLKEVEGKEAYLELRYIDLNPYNRIGISYDTLVLFEEILLYIDKLSLKNIDVNTSLVNFEDVALYGQDRGMKLVVNGKENSLENHTIELLENVLDFVYKNESKKVGREVDVYNNKKYYIVNKFLEDYKNKNLDFYKLLNEVKKDNMTVEEFGKKHSFIKEKFAQIMPNSNMELSTKILIEEAHKNNFEVDIINEEFNLINLKKGNIDENIVQATKSNLEGYASVSILENKVLTKDILRRSNINVPNSLLLKKENYEIDYEFFKENKVVVKPLDTNFGKGIVILQKNSLKKEIEEAIDYAFNYSSYVICEKFFKGQEYRFLVIDNKVVSIIKREAANIIGDGKSVIGELVERENENSLRNFGYRTPLEKIKLGEVESSYLANQGLDFNSVLEAGKKVYLRENSNVSTGGVSEEVLGLHSEYFKEKAILATRSIGAQVCGIDMIIDSDYENYEIIEANFNPAIHMHTYPYKGIGKNIAYEIIKLLEKFNKEKVYQKENL